MDITTLSLLLIVGVTAVTLSSILLIYALSMILRITGNIAYISALQEKIYAQIPGHTDTEEGVCQGQRNESSR